MRQAFAIRPPLIAAWLVDLIVPREHAESISGDFHEEFLDLASKSGPAFARRWYWRQTAKTIAHLVGAEFRAAPWTIAGTILMGYALRWLGSGLPEKVVVALLRTQRPYSSAHVDAYMLFLTWGILIGPLIQSMLIGCIVAIAAKRREMVATTTLCLIFGASTASRLLFWAGPLPENAYLLPFLIRQVSSSIVIVLGGVIVRESRSAMARRSSSR